MEIKEFKALFDQYYDPIRNFLYYKCGDADLAEDLCQDAFMKLWDKRDDVKSETVKSYLYTIANNMLLNKIRHDKVVINFAEKQKNQQEEQSPQYYLEEKEFKEKLDKVIGAMPEKQREVFLMNRIEEMTYQEIADRLSLSVKAIEKRMHGALNHLRNHLDHKL
jgi:RNA polymerase sigma-70 factor (family 1)